MLEYGISFSHIYKNFEISEARLKVFKKYKNRAVAILRLGLALSATQYQKLLKNNEVIQSMFLKVTVWTIL